MVILKKSTFFLSVLLSKESQKETFFDILDSKECFLDSKSEILAKSKKLTFCKGLVHGFCQKIDVFLICFF